MNGGHRYPWLVPALDAFYCFLYQPAWMTLYLVEMLENEDRLRGNQHAAIADEDMLLTARLAASACLTLICAAEAVYSQQDFPLHNPTFSELAERRGSMAVVVHIMEQAVKVKDLLTCSSMLTSAGGQRCSFCRISFASILCPLAPTHQLVN